MLKQQRSGEKELKDIFVSSRRIQVLKYNLAVF